MEITAPAAAAPIPHAPPALPPRALPPPELPPPALPPPEVPPRTLPPPAVAPAAIPPSAVVRPPTPAVGPMPNYIRPQIQSSLEFEWRNGGWHIFVHGPPSRGRRGRRRGRGGRRRCLGDRAHNSINIHFY